MELPVFILQPNNTPSSVAKHERDLFLPGDQSYTSSNVLCSIAAGAGWRIIMLENLFPKICSQMAQYTRLSVSWWSPSEFEDEGKDTQVRGFFSLGLISRRFQVTFRGTPIDNLSASSSFFLWWTGVYFLIFLAWAGRTGRCWKQKFMSARSLGNQSKRGWIFGWWIFECLFSLTSEKRAWSCCLFKQFKEFFIWRKED